MSFHMKDVLKSDFLRHETEVLYLIGLLGNYLRSNIMISSRILRQNKHVLNTLPNKFRKEHKINKSKLIESIKPTILI